MTRWGDMMDRSSGIVTRKEDQISNAEELREKLKKLKDKSETIKNILEIISDDFQWDELAHIDDSQYNTNPSHFTEKEKHFLQVCAAIPFRLGVFASLEEMFKELGVQIIIKPGTKYYSEPIVLTEEEKFWMEEIERLKEKGKKEGDKEYDDAVRTLNRIREEKVVWRDTILRGEYISPAKPEDKPAIILYPDAMYLEYKSSDETMRNLLISTFAHEAMHAYFDRYSHKNIPFVFSVEEPLAEFGMLLFLYETNLKWDKKQKSCYNWSLEYTISQKSCYRYGAGPMKQHIYEVRTSNGNIDTPTRRDLESYKRKL